MARLASDGGMLKIAGNRFDSLAPSGRIDDMMCVSLADRGLVSRRLETRKCGRTKEQNWFGWCWRMRR